MKKFLSLFLALAFAVPLFSCQSPAPEKEPESLESSAQTANYESVLHLYGEAIKLCQNGVDLENGTDRYTDALGITDPATKELFSKILFSTWSCYPGRGKADSTSPDYRIACCYATRDLNRDGMEELVLLTDQYIVALFSFSNGVPVLLGNYHPENTCWIENNGEIHLWTMSDSGYSYRRVYSIRPGGAALNPIIEYGCEDVRSSPTGYYKITKGIKTSIDRDAYKILTRQYGDKEAMSLSPISIFDTSDIAAEVFDSVLKNEKLVFIGAHKYSFLKNYQTQTDGIALCEVESLRYAYADLDGDSVNELMIDCGDTLILRYYEGTVYLYSFPFRQLYNLKTDGSYDWNYTGQNFEYGENKLYFEGSKLKSKKLWSVLNDGEPNAKYYIGGEQVTQEELIQYIENNPKSKIEFVPLEVSWLNPISANEAADIAHEYWKDYGTLENGYTVERTANVIAPTTVYAFIIRHSVENPYTPIDEIWIDTQTGEICAPYFLNGDKYLFPEEARQIAIQYWGVTDGGIDCGLGSTYEDRVVVKSMYGGYYYINWEIHIYSHEEYNNGESPHAISIYQQLAVNLYTGECVPPDPDNPIWGK